MNKYSRSDVLAIVGTTIGTLLFVGLVLLACYGALGMVVDIFTGKV